EEGNVELTLEVALQLGDDVVRTIAMDSTDGVKRGTEVRDSGNSISVPVGNETLGRVFNVLGDTIDLDENIDDSVRRDPIHREEGNVELTLEVALQLGDDVVRTIAMDSTDGVKRGTEVRDSGNSISVPVGNETLGRVFNVLGDTIDLDENIDDSVRRDPIHREAPAFDQLSTKVEILETGIKVIDLLAPYIKGGKVG